MRRREDIRYAIGRVFCRIRGHHTFTIRKMYGRVCKYCYEYKEG